MKKLYVTFSGVCYHDTTDRIVSSAPSYGADQVLVYDDHWLMSTEFYKHNQWIWEHQKARAFPRGFGWFCWKPYIIMHAMDHYMQDGDVVLYTDADTYPIHDLSMLYEECCRIGGCMLFSATGCFDRQWCKRDCLVVMGQDKPPYNEERIQAGVARFMLFEKGPWRPKQFLMEWLTYCLNPLATTFDPSVLAPEYPGFTEHRTEQAIMSLLAHKYGYKLYREACEFGEDWRHTGTRAMEDRDLYPQLFVQVYGHGDRNDLSGSKFRNV